MKRLVCLALFASLGGGCASGTTTTYSTSYKVGDSPKISGKEAEQAHQAAADGPLAQAGFDAPPKFLQSPQPVMSRADTDQRVSGTVEVQIYFDVRGHVARTVVLQSPKESLTASVLAAVSQWRITPATVGGFPATLVAKQSFYFKPGW